MLSNESFESLPNVTRAGRLLFDSSGYMDGFESRDTPPDEKSRRFCCLPSGRDGRHEGNDDKLVGYVSDRLPAQSSFHALNANPLSLEKVLTD